MTLDEGVLNLGRNIPPRDTRLVATAASLAARRDLHPALIPALLDAATRVHQAGGLLEETGQFPSGNLVDLPMNEDASRYIRNGPSFLYRWLPYGTAVVLDRLKVLLLPLIALLLPLFRIAPPLYQWRVRSRVYRWYAAVRDIDLAISSEEPDVASLRSRLHALESDVASVSVPLAYTGEQSICGCTFTSYRKNSTGGRTGRRPTSGAAADAASPSLMVTMSRRPRPKGMSV